MSQLCKSARKSAPMKAVRVHRDIEVKALSDSHVYPTSSEYGLEQSVGVSNEGPAPHSITSKTLSKCTMPQMNTTIKQLEQINAINAMKPQQLKSTRDLTPRSKAAILPKLTKKLNFDVYKPVFKNLQTLNVNDSYLLPQKPTSIHKKYISHNANKIPAPELCDFLDPLPPLMHIVEAPEIMLEYPEAEFDFLEAYHNSIEFD